MDPNIFYIKGGGGWVSFPIEASIMKIIQMNLEIMIPHMMHLAPLLQEITLWKESVEMDEMQASPDEVWLNSYNSNHTWDM